jgi:hypothetical protein
LLLFGPVEPARMLTRPTVFFNVTQPPQRLHPYLQMTGPVLQLLSSLTVPTTTASTSRQSVDTQTH